MNENDKLIIYPNKMRMIVSIIGALLVSLMYLILLFVPIFLYTHNGIGIIIDSIFILIGFVGFIFYGFITIHLINTLISKKEILIVDKKGIKDNSLHIAKEYFIPWDDIEKLFIGSSLGQKLIELKIKNEETHVNSFNWWRKMMLKTNKYFGIQTFSIGLFTTGVQPKDALPKIQELLKKYKKN